MLIKFDDTFDEYLIANSKSLNENSPEIKAINNLATTYRSGWHIIIGSLRLFETIIKLDFIDLSTKSLFTYLIGQFTFQKSYLDLIEEYILIKSPTHSFRKVEENSKTIFEIPISHFSDLSKCLMTVLVSEDDNDFEFYVRLVQKYIKETNQISSLEINFTAGNGGGANSYKTYERFIKRGNIVLAVGDSDKAYPTADVGQTLKQLRRIHQAYKKISIIDLYELEVREKENLIPPSLYLIGTNSSSEEYLKKLLLIENLSTHQEKLFFLDIKDGFEAGKFKSNEDFFNYYQSLFSEVQNLISCTIEEIPLKDDKEKIFHGDSGIIDQFLNNVLGNGLEQQLETKLSIYPKVPQKVITELEDNIKKKTNVFNNIPEYYKPTILQLCKKVICWGCCRGGVIST